MLLDKIFLIIISLVLSLLTASDSLALIEVFVSDNTIVANIGSIVLLSLIVISFIFTAIYPARTVNELRRAHTLSWGYLLCVIGLANFLFVKPTVNSSAMLLLLGVIYIAGYQGLKNRRAEDKKEAAVR